MRVLVVLPQAPSPEGPAAGRHAIALIRGLRGHGVEVDAISWEPLEGDGRRPPEDLGIELVRIGRPQLWRGRYERYIDPWSFMHQPPLGERIRELASNADVVHLEEASGEAASPGLGRPAVVHFHCLAKRDRIVRTPWTAEGRNTIEVMRIERRAWKRSRWLLASSPDVAAELVTEGAHDVTLAPLALDPAHYEPPARKLPPVAGLIGTAAWAPTANSVRALLTETWPEVLRRIPDARLRLAGRGMTRASFPDLPDPGGVEWVGEVASAADFLRELGLLLYPLGRGSGVKVKVLEAMALGLPVVTTPPGSEGIVHGDGVFVGEGGRSISEAAAALLSDPTMRREHGAAAREQFRRDHTPGVATLPLLPLYERMIAEHRRR